MLVLILGNELGRWSAASPSSQPRWAVAMTTASSSVGGEGGGGGGSGLMDPGVVAQTYWQLHVQDRSTWTQEMDLRPGGPRLF